MTSEISVDTKEADKMNRVLPAEKQGMTKT